MIKFKLYLKLLKERPDFRLIITWLWKDFHNVDTDGNASNPASKVWTELYVQNRENKEEIIQVYPISENPLILQISASQEQLVYRVTYFLSLASEGEISLNEELTQLIDKEFLLEGIKDFNIKESLERVKNSIWQKATLENPYPNLKNRSQRLSL